MSSALASVLDKAVAGERLSPEERKRVVEITVDEVKGRIPIIAHIGAISTYHSIDLAKHAEEAGLDVPEIPVIFSKPATSLVGPDKPIA